MLKIPELDQTDIQILGILQENCDLSMRKIAGRLNKSESTIFQRVRRLKEQEYISALVALVNPEKIQMLVAFTQVKLNLHSTEALNLFKQEVISFAEVRECYHTTGAFDFKLKIVVQDVPAYNYFLENKLGKITYLGAVESCVVIGTHKQETKLLLK